MNLSKKTVLNLESLEDRLTPAFDFLYNPTGDIWTVTQVQDDGDVTVSVDATNNLVIDDGAGGPVTVGIANGSLTVNLMDNSSGDMVMELDGLLFGNVRVNLGHGGDFDGDMIRNLSVTTLNGTGVFIAGDLSFTGGNGSQYVEFDDSVSVGGSLSADLGLGSDTVAVDVASNVGSNVTLNGVNQWLASADIIVGGNLSMTVNRENIVSQFDDTGSGITVIGGNFTYVGSNAEDDVFLDVGVVIGGNVNINLGNSILAVFQQVTLNSFGGAPSAIIGGNVTIRGGNNLGTDLIESDANTIIGGNVYINTNNIGNDEVTLLGTIGGSSATVITGLGNDQVTYGMIGNNVRLYANLGLGNDMFTLNDDVTLSYLYIDFGFGSDTFISNYMGAYPFRVYLRNLP